MPVITGQTNPELFPKYYERKLLEQVRNKLVALNYGQKRSMKRNAGREIVFTRFKPLPTNTTPITYRPTPEEGKNISTEQISVKLEEYGDYIDLDEFTEITAYVPLISETTDMLAYQAKETLEELTIRELTTGLNVQYANNKASRDDLTADDKITKDEIRKAVNTLKRENIPPFPDGYYVCFIHPDKLTDLFTIEDLMNLQIAGKTSFETGVVARFNGVKFIESTKMPIVQNSNNVNIYQTVILGNNSYGIVDLDGTSIQMTFTNLDKLGRVKTIGWKAYFAAKRLYEPSIVRLETA